MNLWCNLYITCCCGASREKEKVYNMGWICNPIKPNASHTLQLDGFLNVTHFQPPFYCRRLQNSLREINEWCSGIDEVKRHLKEQWNFLILATSWKGTWPSYSKNPTTEYRPETYREPTQDGWLQILALRIQALLASKHMFTGFLTWLWKFKVVPNISRRTNSLVLL